MTHPRPLQRPTHRLAATAALALCLPLHTATAHHHLDHAPVLRLAQSGEAPAAAGDPAADPSGNPDTDAGMPGNEGDAAGQREMSADDPDGDGDGEAATQSEAPDGTGDGMDAAEETETGTGTDRPASTDTDTDTDTETESEAERTAPADTEATSSPDSETGEGEKARDEGDEGKADESGATEEAARADDDRPRDAEPGPHGRVARATFTSSIRDREPEDRLDAVDADAGEVHFFTEIRDHEGGTIVHQWRYQGRDMGEVRFEVDGPRWRVWSTKTLKPEWTGPWTVRVVDQDDRLLDEYRFRVTGGD
ncbi:MAG: DUF2914 domain-containing protein [Ectothiorhodospira sp.]